MYYELYVDTLFLINFVMNLYLLMLTNNNAGRTATRLRIVLASAVGALLFVIALIIPILSWIVRLLIQTLLTSLLMVKIAFNPQSITGYKKIMESIVGYAFFLGGGLYVMSQYMSAVLGRSAGFALLMGACGLLYLFTSYVMSRRSKKGEEDCLVLLISEQKQIKVRAILDTGNGLIEPISGKPVSVVSKETSKMLWPMGLPEYYRAVPYHSVGCETGIMPGYMVREMTVEMDGIPRKVQDTFIAVSNEELSSQKRYDMLLNPRAINR